MCDICLHNPHLPQCPYAPEPKGVYECSVCGEPIRDGDKYVDGLDGCICADCIDEMSVSEFMELTGIDEMSVSEFMELIGEDFKIAREENE